MHPAIATIMPRTCEPHLPVLICIRVPGTVQAVYNKGKGTQKKT